jgi:hypothetical protein
MRREMWEAEQIGAGRDAGGEYVRRGRLSGAVSAVERFEGAQVAVVCEGDGRFSVVEVGEQAGEVAVGDELVCQLGRDGARVERTKDRQRGRGREGGMGPER